MTTTFQNLNVDFKYAPNYYFIRQKALASGDYEVPQTPTMIQISAKLPDFEYLISIFSWMWAIEHGLEPCMLSFISNACLEM